MILVNYYLDDSKTKGDGFETDEISAEHYKEWFKGKHVDKDYFILHDGRKVKYERVFKIVYDLT